MRILIPASIFAGFVLGACGPKPVVAPLPMLPGDGDTHVAKPPPPKPPPPSDGWTGRTDLIQFPEVKPPGPVELPKIEEWKLGNGLQVYFVKNTRLPVVAIQLAVRAGRMHEPRSRLGVAELTAETLVKGTRKRDATALAKAIDFAGGTISAEATYEASMLSCSVLSRNAGTCFDLISDMVIQPTFPDAELAQRRDAMVAKVQQRVDDAGALASAHALNLLWGNDHVRGWVNSEQSIGTIKRDDVVAWHRAWFVPGNAILVIVGDADSRALRGDLERTFGAWRKGPTPPTPSYTEQGLSGTRIRLVDRPGLTQTQIRIAQFGIKHDDARFFDVLVWNHALGGSGGNSRLARALRADGKPYVAVSSFDRNIDRGAFVVSAVTRNNDAVATTKLLLGEIAKMAKDGPITEEIAAAIIGITGGYGSRFQTAADFAASLINAELHSYGQEYLTNYPVAIGHVTLADAKRAASEILNPKAYVLVLLGDAKDLEPALAKEGWRYEKVAFTDPVTAPYVPPEVPVDAKAAASAGKLIDEALAAKGGKARLSALKGFKLVASGMTTISGQTVPIDITRIVVLPDKMRLDATLKPRGAQEIVLSVGVTGKSGWQRRPGGPPGQYAVVDMTGDDLTTAAFERWREPELILLRAAEPGAKLTPLADDTVDGKSCAVVKLRSPFGAVDLTLYIDKKTKLISRMSYTDGGNLENDDFSDYRDVGGLKIAHKRSTNGGGRATTLEVKGVEIDPSVDPTLFDKPAK
jgi:predicted Zn-dependent peptidase